MRPLMKTNQSGITLIEVMVSMVIFAVGILGITALQLRAFQENVDQHQRDTAIWKAQAIIERISINKSLAAIDQYVIDLSNANFCAVAAPNPICAESSDGANEIAATVCTDVQMATYDVWDILCENNINDDNIEGTVNILSGFTSNLSCNNGPAPCPLGANLSLTITWLSKTAIADPRLVNQTTIRSTNDLDRSVDVDLVNARTEQYKQVFRP